ncbi:MAG: hypothetical protein RIE31_05385 [Alphaproteobacteria bacterium]
MARHHTLSGNISCPCEQSLPFVSIPDGAPRGAADLTLRQAFGIFAARLVARLRRRSASPE